MLELLPKVDGIVPVRLFVLKRKTDKLERRPSLGGTSPTKEL